MEPFGLFKRKSSMGRPPRVLFQGAIYHAIARGNARQRIFFGHDDYKKFIYFITELKKSRPFRLHAYCLMPNHVHLLIEPMETSLSHLMASLLTRYAKYFNKTLDRVGHVFQDRFKAPLCTKDNYFSQLVRYIHLNPVRAELAVEPSLWPYSSHSEYLGASPRNLVDQGRLLSMLTQDFSQARIPYLEFMKTVPATEPFYPTPYSPPLQPDSPPFNCGPSTLLAHETHRPSLERLITLCGVETGVGATAVRGSIRTREVSSARREFSRRACREGYSLAEIAAYLGVTISAVSRYRAKVK